jgi:ABC-type transporter Mla subunit MlaD
VARHIQLLPPEYKSTARPRTIEDSHAALELERLRSELKRLEGVSAFKDEALLHAIRFFEGVLRENQPQSIGQLKRLVSRLKGAIDRECGGLPE